MKILKKIIIILLIIIAIPLVLALFVSKEFKSEGEIVIQKPVTEVYDYVRYIKNQDNFGVWQLSDPEMKTTEEGTDGTVGFKYSWEGKKTGNGSQTLINIVDNEKVETELDFGFGNPAQSYFTTEEVAPNQTKVVWGISGKTPYPWNLMSLFYDMGKDFEKGLQNLKEILENESYTADDKSFVLKYYQETLANLQKSVSNLNKNQIHFKSSDTAWSISQCLEHIVLTEEMIFGMVKENMSKPANPERREEITLSDREIITTVTDRSEKYQAPAMLIGQGKYDNPQTALEDLENQRNKILSFINDTPLEELRNHVSDSPSGASDAFQSLLFIAGHTARHTLQIEEIKANQSFPKE